MKRFSCRTKNRKSIAAAVVMISVMFAFQVTFAAMQSGRVIGISHQMTGEIFMTVSAEPGDSLSFGWEHSFEHVVWNEYYTIQEDGAFHLDSIAVAGFGAGIPAEMDCDYRYENGLVYMEDIKGSVFPEFNWIHSHTQLKWIRLNDQELLTGEDLPQGAKINLCVK